LGFERSGKAVSADYSTGILAVAVRFEFGQGSIGSAGDSQHAPNPIAGLAGSLAAA
jgi:hypothetical protein